MEAANEKKSTNHRFLLLRLAMVLCDVLSVNLAYFIALVVRFYVNFEFNAWATRYVPAFFEFAPFYTLACIVIFGCFKLYNSRWRYAGLGDLNRIIVASLITCVVQVVGSCMFVLRMPSALALPSSGERKVGTACLRALRVLASLPLSTARASSSIRRSISSRGRGQSFSIKIRRLSVLSSSSVLTNSSS